MPTITFVSHRHERYEHGVRVSNDRVLRGVQLDYSFDGQSVDITVFIVQQVGSTFQAVAPQMRTKHARITSDSGSVLKYIGDDPDFVFEVETKWDNTIRRVSVIRWDTGVEIKYFDE